VALRSVGPRLMAENVQDLAEWVTRLTGCPPITDTKVASCGHSNHGDEPAVWFYVEGDAEAGVARLRCIAGGHVIDLLDSSEHWTFPHVWLCPACSQSIAEVVYGIHTSDGKARWLVLAVRCVGCGEVAGVTDMVAGDIPLDELLAQL
jgi:hypothetical protein